MKIIGNGGVPVASDVKLAYKSQTQGAAQAQKGGFARRFDSITISGGRGATFEKELKGRIEQEVRTSTTSGMVASLREQVRSGAYKPDATEIARKMLLLGEAG